MRKVPMQSSITSGKSRTDTQAAPVGSSAPEQRQSAEKTMTRTNLSPPSAPQASNAASRPAMAPKLPAPEPFVSNAVPRPQVPSVEDIRAAIVRSPCPAHQPYYNPGPRPRFFDHAQKSAQSQAPAPTPDTSFSAPSAAAGAERPNYASASVKARAPVQSVPPRFFSHAAPAASSQLSPISKGGQFFEFPPHDVLRVPGERAPDSGGTGAHRQQIVRAPLSEQTYAQRPAPQHAAPAPQNTTGRHFDALKSVRSEQARILDSIDAQEKRRRPDPQHIPD